VSGVDLCVDYLHGLLRLLAFSYSDRAYRSRISVEKESDAFRCSVGVAGRLGALPLSRSNSPTLIVLSLLLVVHSNIARVGVRPLPFSEDLVRLRFDDRNHQ